MVHAPSKPNSTDVSDKELKQRIRNVFCPPTKTFRLKLVEFKDLVRRSRLHIPDGFPQPVFNFGDIIHACGRFTDVTGKVHHRVYAGVVCGLRYHPASSYDTKPDWEYHLCDLPGIKVNVSGNVPGYPCSYFSVYERQLEGMSSIYVRNKPLPKNFLRTIKLGWNRLWERNRKSAYN